MVSSQSAPKSQVVWNTSPAHCASEMLLGVPVPSASRAVAVYAGLAVPEIVSSSTSGPLTPLSRVVLGTGLLVASVCSPPVVFSTE